MNEPLGLVSKAQDGRRDAVAFNRSRGMSVGALTRIGAAAPTIGELEERIAGLLQQRDALRAEVEFCRALLQQRDDAAQTMRAMEAGSVFSAIADAFGCRVEDITGRDRRRPFTWARHCAMALLSEVPGQTKSGVGRIVGGYDHTTVLHAQRRHRQRMAAAIGVPVKSWDSIGRPPERVLRSECRAYAARVVAVRTALGWAA